MAFGIDNLVRVSRVGTGDKPSIDLYCRPLSVDDPDSDLKAFSEIHNPSWGQMHQMTAHSLRERIEKWIILGGYQLNDRADTLEPAVLLEVVPVETNGNLNHITTSMSKEAIAKEYVRALPQAYQPLTDLASAPPLSSANGVYFLDLTSNNKFAGKGLARNMIEYAKGLLLHGLYAANLPAPEKINFTGTFSPKPNDYDSNTDPFKFDIVRLHVPHNAFVVDVLPNARPNHPTPDVLAHCYKVPGYLPAMKAGFEHKVMNGHAS